MPNRRQATSAVSDLEILKKAPIFVGLDDQQLEKVLAVTRRVSWPAGQPIMREGDTGDTMCILLSGTVQVSKQVTLPSLDDEQEPQHKVLGRLDGKDSPCFGEMSILEDSVRSASVIPLAPCELLEIHGDDFSRLAESDYYIGYRVVRNIAKIVSARLRKNDRDLLKLTTVLSLALAKRK